MDDERYGEGKGLSSGVETLGKTAMAAATTTNIGKLKEGINVVKNAVPKLFKASKNAIRSNWHLFKEMPKPYILNGIKNWVITPAIGGYAVNKLTKVATDALTEGRGLDFD